MGILDRIKERNQVTKLKTKVPRNDVDLLLYLVKELTSIASYEEQDLEYLIEGYLERLEYCDTIINHMQHDRVV